MNLYMYTSKMQDELYLGHAKTYFIYTNDLCSE